MKKLNYLLLILIASSAFVFSQSSTTSHLPELNRESDPDYHKARKFWLESMHLTEPDVDYKLLTKEFKSKRMNLKNYTKSKFQPNSPELLKYISDDGRISGTWKERGSNNQSGRIHTADVDLNAGLIYAASAGGNVWRGTINGENWTCLNNSMQFSIRSIKVEIVNDKRRIIVFSEKNVYYSEDEGFTWIPSVGLENIARWGWIQRGVVINDNDGRNLYLLANEWDYDAWKQIRSIYYSEDNGENFIKVFSVSNNQLMDIWGIEHSIGEYGYENDGNISLIYNKLICVHRDTVFAISQNNKEILSINPRIIFNNPNNLKLSGSDAGGKVRIYFNTRDNNSGNTFVQISDDFGQNILESGLSSTDYFMHNSFGVSKLDANLSYLGGVNCFVSYDAGINWNLINNWAEYYPDPLNKLHADIPGIKSFRTAANKEFFLISTDGGIYKTRDDYSVENISLEKLNVSQYYSIYTHQNPEGSVIFAGSQDQGFQISETVSDKILDFEQTISGDYGSLTSGDSGRTIWTVYPGFAMFYPDALSSRKNSTWNFRNLSNAKVWMPPIVTTPGKPYEAYIAPGSSNTAESKIWKLTYDTQTERIIPKELSFRFNSDDEQDNYVTAIGISPIDNNYLYALTRKGKFYSSTDAGSTWTETIEFIGPGYNYLHGTTIYASKVNLGEVYIAGSGYSNPGIYFSEDNGVTFHPIEGLPPIMIYEIDLNPEEDAIFAATSLGPFVYIVSENKWYDIAGLDAPDQSYWSVNYIPEINTARFATYGRGIWDFEIEKLKTDILGEAPSNNISFDVYPIPASDIINISISDIDGEIVSIKMFDIDGRLVDIYHDGLINGNNFELKIDISKNKSIRSGNYILIVSTDKSMFYKKISVIN
ncbi:MAG: T9SS type A sorting domain-containing protein [Candidatus Kapabacteria bacterium]|nr:T9SS type A sorting domain-containing protein [Ignavibacteriota bacterium]MCW5883798.1 T9SS type A sorting domain-containing protein [Candidatus Kapabacteria bacterium]